MPAFPESGVKLVADTASYTKAMEDAIFLADYFDSYGEISVDISANVDTASFDVELPQDNETIDVEIDANVEGIEDLPLDGETVDYTVDTEVEGIEDLPLDGTTVNFTVEGDVTGDAENLPAEGETIDTTLNVEETPAAKETLDAVNTIKNLKILETVWNIAGTAVDIFGKFSSFAIQPMLTLDDAVARVNATTGNAIPNARELIQNIFYDDLGESIDQVANLVTKAGQMKLPIDEATRAALEFTHTFKDQNPEQVLDTMNALVINKLAPNFKTAGDMLVTAFQNGANKGGDLLTAINNNATAIHDLGLNGPEALSFIKTGMDAGFKSADEVLKVLEKIKQNVANAAGNEKSDVSKTLKILGIANPAETGEAWTADFFKKVIEGIKNAPGLSDTEKEQMFSNLVGGKMGGKTFSAFLQLSPEDADNVFKNMAGASERAASAIDDSLSGAIDDFMLAAQKAAQEFLSSKQIDLPGKIAALKTGLQDALNELAKGGTLGDALTVALKPIGFDDEFQSLESALGNFVIGILQAVKAIQEATGHGEEAKGTQATITKMAEKQLTFDLKVGNPSEVSGEIATAVSRGVAPDKIVSTVGDAVKSLINQGAVQQAQALLNEVNKGVGNITFTVSDPIIRAQLEGQGLGTSFTVPITPEMTPEQVQKTIDDTKAKFMAEGGIPLDATVTPSITQDTVNGLQKELDTAAAKLKKQNIDNVREAKLAAADAGDEIKTANTELQNTATQTTTSVDTMNTKVAATQTAANNASTAINKQTNATDAVADSASSAAAPVANVADSMDKVNTVGLVLVTTLDGVAVGIQKVIDTAGSLASAANDVAKKQGEVNSGSSGSGKGTTNTQPGKGHALGTRDAIGTFMTGESGREIVTSNEHLGVLNNATTEKIMAALQGWIPGGSFAKGSTTNVINNTNYIPSEAVADTLGYRQAATLRGAS